MKKTIVVNLYNGTFKDVAIAHNKRASAFVVYYVPTDKVENLKKLRETDPNLETILKHAGIYILVGEVNGELKIYIGQATNKSGGGGMLDRVRQHSKDEEIMQIYEGAYFITTTNNSWDEADLDFLEYFFIQKAYKIMANSQWIVLNKKDGHNPLIDSFREFDLTTIAYEQASLLLSALQLPQFNNLNLDQPLLPSCPTVTAPVATQMAITTSSTLFLKSSKYDAEGYFAPSGLFVIKSGGKIRKEISPKMSSSYKQLREKYKDHLQENGDTQVTDSDLTFNSISAAASFVAGANRNGRDTWKDSQGRTLNSIPQPVEEEPPTPLPTDCIGSPVE